MVKLSILLAIAIIFNLVSGAYILDDYKEIQFHKTVDGSGEYDFKYKLDNGDINSGKTIHVSGKLYFIFGANDILYSLEVGKDEIDKNEFTKLVPIVERKGNEFFWKNDLHKYVLNIAKNYLSAIPYATAWDVKNICFSRSNAEERTFNYTILSANNPRKYTGTTYCETDDPLIQRIHLKDGNQRDGIYEIEFTENELRSNEMFCRGITKVISAKGVLGVEVLNNIDPNLLKSLAG